jgi:transcriptional regulator with XRE-family HTH domain
MPGYIRGMSDKADFGQAIVFLAEKAGLSQKTLAKALKVTPKTVSAWNKGRRRPNRNAMQLLPGALGCSMEEILTVAAYHAEWRQKLRHRKQDAGDVKEVPNPPPGSDDRWHREMALHLEGVTDLLATKIAQKLSVPKSG